jgi:hypothetical protein
VGGAHGSEGLCMYHDQQEGAEIDIQPADGDDEEQ